MNKPEHVFLKILHSASLLFLLGLIMAILLLFSCRSAIAAENASQLPGVLEYARKYGEEKQKADVQHEGGKNFKHPPQTIKKRNVIPTAESELRRKLRQQEVILDQIRQENHQLRLKFKESSDVDTSHEQQKKIY